MLLIKTIVKPSEYGLGLFSEIDIPSKSIIWILNPMIDKVLEKDILNKKYLSEHEMAFLKKYAYNDGKNVILCSDDARYINHSFNNYNLDDWIHPVFGSVTSTKRKILRGEELLSNYENFDTEFESYKHLLK